jgi:malonate transporter
MPVRDYVPVAVAKLLVHPLLVWGVGTRPSRAGLPLDRFALTVMVLVAALPSASNVSLLAERFGADNGPHRAHHPADHRGRVLHLLGAVALLRRDRFRLALTQPDAVQSRS